MREAIKEIAPLDGAVIVAADGTIDAACRYLNATAANVTLSKGLGARHWAAAAITKKTKAVAVTVSESNGTVRLFHKGEVLLRVEPFRRAMKWKDFEYEPPPQRRVTANNSQRSTFCEHNLDKAEHQSWFLDLLDAYMRHPMGDSRPIPAENRERLVHDLHKNEASQIFFAIAPDQAVGMAVCFVGYSTFYARPLVNIHDLFVQEPYRGSGVGLLITSSRGVFGR